LVLAKSVDSDMLSSFDTNLQPPTEPLARTGETV
jgi:hypothetical protein